MIHVNRNEHKLAIKSGLTKEERLGQERKQIAMKLLNGGGEEELIY